ncbi:MAG TPA: PadR family transcriptional regulator [Tepidiformaceae bacterium]|nr:PadR family transcriptional regulator [Tepidiformaceae bacterium]
MSLKFAILGLLSHEELSGYELTRRFGHSVGYFWHARSQQIYPELGRLEAEGLVSGRLVQQVGRPDKTVYAITEEGSRELAAWVTTPSPLTFGKDEFLVKVWSYGLAERGQAIAALAEHRTKHEERLAGDRALKDGFRGLDASSVDARFLGAFLTLDAGIAMEEAFVAWCAGAEQVLRYRAEGV